MMVNLLAFLPLFFLVYLCGIFVYTLHEISIPEKIGLSLILGSGIATVTSFVSYIVFFKYFSLFHVVVSLLLVISIICLYFFRWRHSAFLISETMIKGSKLLICTIKHGGPKSLLAVTLIVLVLFSFITNSFWPITDWDSLALYDFRAKVIVESGGFAEHQPLSYFYQYPPYTSLLHTFTYLSGSTLSPLWYSLLYLSFLLCFFGLLSRSGSDTISLFATTLLAASPLIFTHSMRPYTNLPHTIFIALGLLYLLQWYQSNRKVYLLIGTLLVSFSFWIRISEPYWIIAICLLILRQLKYKADLLLFILSICTIFLFKSIWPTYVNFYKLEVTNNDFDTLLRQIAINISYDKILQQITKVASFLFVNFIMVYHLYLLLFLTSFSLALMNRKIVRMSTFILSFATVGLVFAGTFAFSFIYQGWSEIPDSAIRSSMVVLPLLIYSIFSPFQKKVIART